MDGAVRESFSNYMLEEGAKRYDIAIDRLSLIGAFQNFIYEYQRDGKNYILRFTPQSHRTIDAVHAELEWINHLFSHGISVPKSVHRRGEMNSKSFRTVIHASLWQLLKKQTEERLDTLNA